MSKWFNNIVFLIIFPVFLSSNIFAQKVGNKDDFTYLYSEALKNKMQENYDVAINYFEECLKIFPQS